jgi:hypothetical protein
VRSSTTVVVDFVLAIVANMVQFTTKHWTTLILYFSYIIIISVVIAKRVNPLLDFTKESGGAKRHEEHFFRPSLSKIMSINAAGRFSLTSMAVQHGSSGSWYLAHLHEKYSAGWNRTVSLLQD